MSRMRPLPVLAAQSAPLSDADWGFVVEGMRSDLAGTFSLEVRAGGTLPNEALYLPHACTLARRVFWACV